MEDMYRLFNVHIYLFIILLIPTSIVKRNRYYRGFLNGFLNKLEYIIFISEHCVI